MFYLPLPWNKLNLLKSQMYYIVLKTQTTKVYNLLSVSCLPPPPILIPFRPEHKLYVYFDYCSTFSLLKLHFIHPC